MEDFQEIGMEPKEAKISAKNKMILLALFGVLLGFVIKTEAAKRVTVGFEDYKIGGTEKVFDISQLQKELEQKKASQSQIQSAPEGASGNSGTCSVGSGENCNQ